MHTGTEARVPGGTPHARMRKHGYGGFRSEQLLATMTLLCVRWRRVKGPTRKAHTP